MKKQGFSKALSNAWKKFRGMPILFNLTLILLILGVIALVSFYGMSIGTRHSSRCEVPNFVGHLLSEAEEAAVEGNLEIIINDSLYVQGYPGGVVLDQLPKGGVIVKPGRKVYVTINSFRQRMVDVPYVAGYSLRQAKNMLEVAGLSIERIEYARDLATNYVIAEYLGKEKITANSKLQAEKGSGVRLRVGVSEGARPIVAPKVLGRSLVEAKSRLWETGLNIGEVTYDEGIKAVDRSRAKVCWQSVRSGRGVSYGASISLHLTLDTEKLNAAMDGQDVMNQGEMSEADSLENLNRQHLLDSLAGLDVRMLQDSVYMQDSLVMVGLEKMPPLEQKEGATEDVAPTTETIDW